MIQMLLETGLRISELCLLSFDCLEQDSQGDWWLRYNNFKMHEEQHKPISNALATVILTQQGFIREHLGTQYHYLFCSNQAAPRSKKCRLIDGFFRPVAKPPLGMILAKALNTLAREKNICNAAGKLWHFQTHQFRHTVGTAQINQGVPQHIVQKYLGHKSPDMTGVYAHLHDQTLKQEFAKFYRNTVDVIGRIVEPNCPQLDGVDLQWLKHNILAQALPNGSCALPAPAQACPHANACLTCAHFRTTAAFLVQHRTHLEQAEQFIAKAHTNGWTRQAEMNQQIAENLRTIIKALEGDA